MIGNVWYENRCWISSQSRTRIFFRPKESWGDRIREIEWKERGKILIWWYKKWFSSKNDQKLFHSLIWETGSLMVIQWLNFSDSDENDSSNNGWTHKTPYFPCFLITIPDDHPVVRSALSSFVMKLAVISIGQLNENFRRSSVTIFFTLCSCFFCHQVKRWEWAGKKNCKKKGEFGSLSPANPWLPHLHHRLVLVFEV